MEINESFKDDLRIEFQGRLRVRWSGKQQSYLIQQRVGRNLIGNISRKTFKDSEKVQDLAEGYRTIMVVSPAEKTRCPECSTWLDVPNRTTAQIKCEFCKFKGRNVSFIAGYYPLNSSLIQHLKSIDPLRDGDKDMQKKLDQHNEKLTSSMQKKISQDAEDYTSDNLNRLMGILSVGYSGMKNNSLLPESPRFKT